MNMASMTKVISLSLMTALLLNCEKSNKNTLQSSPPVAGVVNGHNVTDDQLQANGLANSVVGIVSEVEGPIDPATGKKTAMTALCTGTLIAQDIVLTAGHCLTDAVAEKVFILFQATEMFSGTKPAVATRAKSFLIKKEYAESQSSKDDLAMIILAKAAPTTMTPAKIIPRDFNIEKSFSQSAIGYGQADERHNADPSNDGSGTLRWTKMNLLGVPHAPQVPPRMDGMIFFNSTKTGVCHGDSGGPLLATSNPMMTVGMLAGVAESVIPIYIGEQEADYLAANKQNKLEDFYKKYPDAHICSGYSVYVNVANHLDWIESTTAQLRAQVAAAAAAAAAPVIPLAPAVEAPAVETSTPATTMPAAVEPAATDDAASTDTVTTVAPSSDEGAVSPDNEDYD